MLLSLWENLRCHTLRVFTDFPSQPFPLGKGYQRVKVVNKSVINLPIGPLGVGVGWGNQAGWICGLEILPEENFQPCVRF